MSHGKASEASISPFWVALNHKNSNHSARRWYHWEPNSLGDSYLLWALQDLRSKRNCSATKIQCAITNLQVEWKLPHRLTSDEFLYMLEKIWPKVGSLSPQNTKAIQSWIKSDEELREFDHDLVAENRPHLGFIAQSFLKVSELSKARKQYHRVLDFFETAFFKSCPSQSQDKLEIPKIRNYGVGIASDEDITDTMNEWFGPSHPQPLAVGYCDQVYKHKSISPLTSVIIPRALRIQATGCSAHYSLIVGKRPDTSGKCEYLIRNSYGEGFWTDKWECLCSNVHTGENEACRANSRHALMPADGQKVLGCWAPQDKLAPYVYDLEQL